VVSHGCALPATPGTLIDELLDEPPPPGESFLLDGQAIVLEDYLAVRPDRATALASLLRDGRLEAGAWYVLRTS